MIKKLSIQNYALIDRLEIDFNPGFSVITGETGAGKSIILGALSLILGQRADIKAIKDNSLKSVIEGLFDVSAYNLELFFIENELEYDAENCILRRELLPSGKSRAFINDTPVSLNLLKELGEKLIDIHSQHQNLLLGDDKFQLKVIDLLAQNTDRLVRYKKEYHAYQSLQRELKILQQENRSNKQEEDYLRFQLNQLDEASLKAGEQENLEQEQAVLSHAEEIKSELFTLIGISDGEDGGLLQFLKMMVDKSQALTRIYPEIKEISDRLQSNYIDLKDVSAEISDMQERIGVDPKRLEEVQERLDLIYNLQQKHQVRTIDQLLEIQAVLADKLEQIDTSDERIKKLEVNICRQSTLVEGLAAELTLEREKECKRFSLLLEEKASPLGLTNLKFEARIERKMHLDDMGAEWVRFYFSANKNQALQPVSEVASGGEISRLMLCIKALIANATALPTIVFDEVDTGVSGEIADKMGNIMQDMSRYMQVMSITHLPQVASKGQFHYRVFKTDTENRTLTGIEMLMKEYRVEEIARMLSGASLTAAALTNARTLLGHE